MAAADHKAWLQRRVCGGDSRPPTTFHKEYADGDFAAATREEDPHPFQRGAALDDRFDWQFDWRLCFCLAGGNLEHFQSRDPRHVFENRTIVDAGRFWDHRLTRCSIRVVNRADGLAIAVRGIRETLGHHYFGVRSWRRGIAARRRGKR